MRCLPADSAESGSCSIEPDSPHLREARDGTRQARAAGESEGFVKVVIDRARGKLLGATIMAFHAGDMLATLTMPLHTRNGDLGPLLATTFAHRR